MFKAAIRGKINVYLKIMIENPKIEYFYMYFNLTDGLGMEFIAF